MVIIERDESVNRHTITKLEIDFTVMTTINTELHNIFGAKAPYLNINDIICIITNDYEDLSFDPASRLPTSSQKDCLVIECIEQLIDSQLDIFGKTSINENKIDSKNYTVRKV